MISEKNFRNQHLMRGADARQSLRRIVQNCTEFAENVPQDEINQANELKNIISSVGKEISVGALVLGDVLSEKTAINRLYKANVGSGRLKLQLFSLTTGEIHPPHAHGNLLSCQIVLEGRVRMREFTLLNRLEGDQLEIQQHPVKVLEQGQGVYTLQFKNNIHWQEGLSDETILLNINWQDFLPHTEMTDRYAVHGRCYIDWSRAKKIGQEGRYVVPEVMSGEEAQI